MSRLDINVFNKHIKHNSWNNFIDSSNASTMNVLSYIYCHKHIYSELGFIHRHKNT